MLRSVISVLKSVTPSLGSVNFVLSSVITSNHCRSLSMVPPKSKRVTRQVLSKKSAVSKARAGVDSEESRSPPRPEDDPNSRADSMSGAGTGTRDGQETGGDSQSDAQGTSSAGQSPNAE